MDKVPLDNENTQDGSSQELTPAQQDYIRNIEKSWENWGKRPDGRLTRAHALALGNYLRVLRHSPMWQMWSDLEKAVAVGFLVEEYDLNYPFGVYVGPTDGWAEAIRQTEPFHSLLLSSSCEDWDICHCAEVLRIFGIEAPLDRVVVVHPVPNECLLIRTISRNGERSTVGRVVLPTDFQI